jgi:uncharacterized protein YukE
MTGFLGMDVPAVRNLATQLSAKADEIESIMSALTSQLHSVQWMGSDADTFRNDWQSVHRVQLTAVAQALRDAATRANNNATQQEQASGAL